MDDSINNFMVDNRIRFLENRDNNSRWCDPDVSVFATSIYPLQLTITYKSAQKIKTPSINVYVLNKKKSL